MRFLSVGHCLSNQKRLATAVSDGSPLSYREAISQLRNYPAAEQGISVSFPQDELTEQICRRGYFSEIVLENIDFTSTQRQRFRDQLSAALDVIGTADDQLQALVELVVTDVVFIGGLRTGGSSGSHLPGVVCVHPSEEWTDFDMAEVIAHEAVHLNVFLGEMVHGMYTVPTQRLEDDDAQVISTLRIGERRPLDKALHSALVAVPVMYLRHQRGEDRLAVYIAPFLKDCYNDLLDHERFFNAYGWSVVRDLGEFAETLDYGVVWRGLRDSDDGQGLGDTRGSDLRR